MSGPQKNPTPSKNAKTNTGTEAVSDRAVAERQQRQVQPLLADPNVIKALDAAVRSMHDSKISNSRDGGSHADAQPSAAPSEPKEKEGSDTGTKNMEDDWVYVPDKNAK